MLGMGDLSKIGEKDVMDVFQLLRDDAARVKQQLWYECYLRWRVDADYADAKQKLFGSMEVNWDRCHTPTVTSSQLVEFLVDCVKADIPKISVVHKKDAASVSDHDQLVKLPRCMTTEQLEHALTTLVRDLYEVNDILMTTDPIASQAHLRPRLVKQETTSYLQLCEPGDGSNVDLVFFINEEL